MSSALIIGVGGLGCPAALALARGGVERLTLVDPDRVELSNLHRQPFHLNQDLGQPKVLSARRSLLAAFPELDVRPLQERVDARNAPALFRAHDVVVDGTDGIETKLLLSDVAVQTGVPLVHGGVLRMDGLAMLIRAPGPCLRCLFREPPAPDEAPSCAQAGVLGSVAGVVGALQATLALEALRRPAGQESAAWLHRFDARTLGHRRVRVERDPDCPACRRLESQVSP